jgi:hypothetical protein
MSPVIFSECLMNAAASPPPRQAHDYTEAA